MAAFEASRKKTTAPGRSGGGSGADIGYRLLSQMLGGILGGVGLGWLLDHFAHTGPWGLLTGILGGSALSIYSTVRMAIRMGAPPKTTPDPPAGPGPDDVDD